jgi:flavin-dependent dehydrogenase
MIKSTDVFIIGGGPAGLAAAIAARKRGFSVVVADGAKPPVDKPCGEGLMPDALASLRELGVTVESNEGFAIRGIRFLDGSLEVHADLPEEGIGLRRPVLHQKMAERASELGVCMLWNSPVSGISAEGVVVDGRTIAAQWIVGADGIHSRVRRWAGLEVREPYRGRYAFTRHYRIEPWCDCVEIYWGRGVQAYVTPVGGQEVSVVLISHDAAMRFSSIDKEFPRLARRLRHAEMSSERGAVTMTRSLERVYRGRAALIGDASGSVDAITGEGLCLSFHQAQALAAALETGDLRRYQDAHRRLARRPAFMGALMLRLDRPGELRRHAIRALAAHPDLFARLLAVHVGATSAAHIAATGVLLGWRLVAA